MMAPLYINNSFCPEIGYINYCIRKAKTADIIMRYKVRNGVYWVQKDEYSKLVEVAHVLDLEDLDIPLLPRKKKD